MKVSDNSVISIPLRNLISLIAGSCIAVYGYFGLTERLNFLEHELELKNKDIVLNSEFRVKWPRGEFGALPDDALQDMRIEQLQEQVSKIKEQLDEQDRIK